MSAPENLSTWGGQDGRQHRRAPCSLEKRILLYIAQPTQAVAHDGFERLKIDCMPCVEGY